MNWKKITSAKCKCYLAVLIEPEDRTGATWQWTGRFWLLRWTPPEKVCRPCSCPSAWRFCPSAFPGSTHPPAFSSRSRPSCKLPWKTENTVWEREREHRSVARELALCGKVTGNGSGEVGTTSWNLLRGRSGKRRRQASKTKKQQKRTRSAISYLANI